MKCLLFDLDGTLVSTGGAGAVALERAFFETYKIKNVMKKVDASGKTDPSIVREIFQTVLAKNPTDDEIIKVQEWYLKFLPEECRCTKNYEIYPGILMLLERLSREPILMGLGTGNLEQGARIKLDRAGINHYLPFGGYGSDSEHRGELLEMGHRRAEKISGKKIDCENVYVIGDTPRDIWAARHAKFKVIAVATGGYSVDVLKKEKPDYLFEDFSNVEMFFDTIELKA